MLYINSAGTVGVGTTSPNAAARLDVAGPFAVMGTSTCQTVGFKDTDTTLLWGTTTCPAGWNRLEQSGRGWYWNGTTYADAHIVLCCPS